MGGSTRKERNMQIVSEAFNVFSKKGRFDHS